MVKYTLAFLFFFCLAGCDYRKKEEELRRKEAALQELEQQLLLKEKTLALKEDELAKRVQRFDSTAKADTMYIRNDTLAGNWNVRMACTETTCAGSAVGDTKTETWQLSYQGSTLIAKAFVNDQLVRSYTGFYTGNTIELAGDKSGVAEQPAARMVVRLRMVDATHLEGQREIVRENNCKILYALQLEKLND